MRRSILALALAALLASPVAAQIAPFPAGPTNQSSVALIAPTPASPTENSNRIATTQWVNNFVNAGLPLASGKIWIGSVGNIATAQTPSGDLTVSNGGVFTLATVNANVGAFGSATQCATITTNAKGLITAASAATCTPAIGSITGLAAGIATWAATPSSANLRAALTDETGTGLAYFQGGDIGTPSAGNAANLTLGANQVTRANLAQGVARSVVGVAGNATANVADIQGTANQFLGINPAGTALGFQSLRQIIPFSLSTVSLPQASTLFTMFLGNATEANVSVACPIAGTFKNLTVFSTAPAAGQTLTATLRIASVDTALTCTITGTGTSCSDTTHTATCAAGNLFVMKLVTSATTGTLAAVGGGLEFDTP